MTRAPATGGQLRPDDERVSLSRAPLSEAFRDLARHAWIPRWNLAPGETLDVPVLAYPSINVVFEAGVAACYLPTLALSYRTLSDMGWAAGLLLQPGAGHLVVAGSFAKMLGAEREVQRADQLVARLTAAPDAPPETAKVVAAYEHWLEPLLDDVSDEVHLVNAVTAAIENDPTVTTTRQLVDRFGIGERTLQRLLILRTGFTPHRLIQRRRLQEAAQHIRDDPARALSAIAAEAGYADQAHFTREFRTVIGVTPGAYRAAL